jgi:hypothetical protein
MAMDQISPSLDDEVPKKANRGNRTDRRHTGRPPGTRPRIIRESQELLEQLGGDAPHIALLKLSRDEKIDLPLRAQMAAWCAPYFASKFAPTPPPPRFLTESPGLGELTDAASALRFTARIAEQVQAGKLDTELGKFFANLAALYVNLLDKVAVESEIERHRELRVVAE